MTMDYKDRWIRAFNLSLPVPSLKDNTGDADRLIRGIRKEINGEDARLELPLIQKIPPLLRKYEYKSRPVLYRDGESWRLIDLLPPEKEAGIYGIAADLGSSTVVVRLLDLGSGKALDEISFVNPQQEIGPDILTRIHYTSGDGGLEELQDLLNSRLDIEIKGLAKKNNIAFDSIVGMSAAGNTTMTHFFLGLDPFWICREPYIPAINRPGLIKASELGIGINPESPVLVFPGAGSYLGGDIMAGILSSGMNKMEGLCILVDVGTNAEVILGNSEWLMACAGAAGPALEGGVAGMGMMAGPGVMDRAVIDPVTREFTFHAIGDRPPIGICGSGLIDLVAQLFLSGMIDMRGKFIKERCGDRLKEIDGIMELSLVSSKDSATEKALSLSQTDIDSLLRSKAAMYTILKTITNMVNVSFEDISNFYIAGTFGLYIDPRSAISIGMIPDLPLEIYKPLGNTSLEGACMALLSSSSKDEVYRIRDRVTYIELNVNQDFMNRFSAAKFIPHTDRSMFPSVKEQK